MVVGIAEKRITYDGLNLKTGQGYALGDITNQDYQQAVEDFILENIEGV